jgi:ribosome-interacting GTPase 1
MFVHLFLAINPFKAICNIICVWQLLDLPGIIEGAKDGKGRGRQVLKAIWLLARNNIVH